MSPALAIRDLRFGYERQTTVLDGVGLDVAAGEFVALLGPNGSGKSTLLRLAGGLRKPWEGSVTWRGEEVAGLEPRVRAREIALMPQSVQPVYRLRVDEVVALGRHPHRDAAWSGLDASDRRAVDGALEACEATALGARQFDDLSGGEKQRVLLASALAQGGELLLLDEPTAALDLHHQTRAFHQMRSLARSGRALLVATHDVNLAAAFADRVVLLRGGRVIDAGVPQEVLTPQRVGEVFGEGLWVGRHPAAAVPCVLPMPLVADEASGGASLDPESHGDRT